jgi:hypothetical protein
MPIPLKTNLPQHQLASPKRVHCLQTHRRDHGRDKAVPHDLVGEIVRDLFEGKEDAADGGTKCDGDSRSRGGGEDFAFLGFVFAVLGEEFEVDVCAAASYVD